MILNGESLMSAKKLWIRVFGLGIFSVMIRSENISDSSYEFLMIELKSDVEKFEFMIDRFSSNT